MQNFASQIFDEVLSMPLYPNCVELLHFRNSFLQHIQAGTRLSYAFYLLRIIESLIDNRVIFRVYSSILTQFQNILRDNLGYSPIFQHYSDIFRHIQAYLESYITVAYSEPWHIQNPEIFKSLPYLELKASSNNNCIFRILGYSEHWHIKNVMHNLEFCQTSKVEVFPKRVKVNIFPKYSILAA